MRRECVRSSPTPRSPATCSSQHGPSRSSRAAATLTPEPACRPAAVAASDPVFATKALRKFLTSLTSRESPVLLDLGPVVGSNVSFFGEQLGCKIFVEDIFADLDRHVREGKLDELPAFLEKRFPQADGTVDGILCWDVFDYLDRRGGAGARRPADARAAARRRAARLLRHRAAARRRATRSTSSSTR